jgi:hypothetical protein
MEALYGDLRMQSKPDKKTSSPVPADRFVS